MPVTMYIAIVALTWGGYPLLARASGIGTPIGALILTLCALLPIAGTLVWQGDVVRPSPAAFAQLAVAGVLMGTGTIAFNYVANNRQFDASISIPIIDTVMLMVTVVGAIIFFSEPITLKKIIGVGLLVAGIAILKPE